MPAIYFQVEIPIGVSVRHRTLLATEAGICDLIVACKAKLPVRRGRRRIPDEQRCACGRYSLWTAIRKGHICKR